MKPSRDHRAAPPPSPSPTPPIAATRKTRADSVLKNLPPERQEEIIAWCETPRSSSCRGGIEYAREQLARTGIHVWPTSIRRFRDWFQLMREVERARDYEADLDPDPASFARARQAGQKLLVDLDLARQDPRLFAVAAATADRQHTVELLAARERRRERQWDQMHTHRQQRLQLARDRFEDSKLRYEREHAPKPKPTGLTPEVLRQIEEAAKLL